MLGTSVVPLHPSFLQWTTGGEGGRLPNEMRRIWLDYVDGCRPIYCSNLSISSCVQGKYAHYMQGYWNNKHTAHYVLIYNWQSVCKLQLNNRLLKFHILANEPLYFQTNDCWDFALFWNLRIRWFPIAILLDWTVVLPSMLLVWMCALSGVKMVLQ